MATGRTSSKWVRVYVDGYHISTYTTKIGPLETTFDAAELTTLADAAKGYLPTWSHIKPGTLNGVLDPTATSGLHALASAAAGTRRLVTVCVGMRAEPALGDPCFTAEATQDGYHEVDSGGATTVSVPFGEYSASATTLLYPRAWGWILNPNTARTAANSSTGIDDLIAPATSTTRGGYMVYHVTASSNAVHTATLKVQDSDTNIDADFDDLLTTGAITVTAGVSGIVALAPTATVRQYLRWQMALGTATSVTFLLAFVRG